MNTTHFHSHFEALHVRRVMLDRLPLQAEKNKKQEPVTKLSILVIQIPKLHLFSHPTSKYMYSFKTGPFISSHPASLFWSLYTGWRLIKKASLNTMSWFSSDLTATASCCRKQRNGALCQGEGMTVGYRGDSTSEITLSQTIAGQHSILLRNVSTWAHLCPHQDSKHPVPESCWGMWASELNSVLIKTQNIPSQSCWGMWARELISVLIETQHPIPGSCQAWDLACSPNVQSPLHPTGPHLHPDAVCRFYFTWTVLQTSSPLFILKVHTSSWSSLSFLFHLDCSQNVQSPLHPDTVCRFYFIWTVLKMSSPLFIQTQSVVFISSGQFSKHPVPSSSYRSTLHPEAVCRFYFLQHDPAVTFGLLHTSC